MLCGREASGGGLLGGRLLRRRAFLAAGFFAAGAFLAAGFLAAGAFLAQASWRGRLLGHLDLGDDLVGLGSGGRALGRRASTSRRPHARPSRPWPRSAQPGERTPRRACRRSTLLTTVSPRLARSPRVAYCSLRVSSRSPRSSLSRASNFSTSALASACSSFEPGLDLLGQVGGVGLERLDELLEAGGQRLQVGLELLDPASRPAWAGRRRRPGRPRSGPRPAWGTPWRPPAAPRTGTRTAWAARPAATRSGPRAWPGPPWRP